MRAEQEWSARVFRRDKNPWNIARDIQGNYTNSHYAMNDLHLSSFLSSLTNIFQFHFNYKDDAVLCSLNDDIWILRIDALTVYRLLRRLKLKPSPSYDGISARLLMFNNIHT